MFSAICDLLPKKGNEQFDTFMPRTDDITGINIVREQELAALVID